jgi:hypothetical protein
MHEGRKVHQTVTLPDHNVEVRLEAMDAAEVGRRCGAEQQQHLCRMWCGVVWCGVVWCGVVWCGVVWCGVV